VRFSARKCRDRQEAGVDRSSGAKRMGRVRISARGALLSVGPTSCPECAGSGTAACRSVRAGLLFDCLSALVRDQRWASKRQDPAHACSEAPSTFGRRGPRCGEDALSSARLIGCAPKAVGDAWLIPTRARRRATRLLVQRARGAARGTRRPTSRASARRPRPARSRRPSARTVQDALDVDAEPLVVAEPRRHPARTARGDARTLMPHACVTRAHAAEQPDRVRGWVGLPERASVSLRRCGWW